jgi:hypothetical protein
MEFDDLSHDEKDLIRRTVFRSTPVQVISYKYIDFLKQQIPREIRELAKKAFLEQNMFIIDSKLGVGSLCADAPEATSLIRRIRIRGDLACIAKTLERFAQLQEVEMSVQEAQIVRDESSPREGYRDQLLRPQDVPFELNRLVLRNEGVQALRKLRFPKVCFVSHEDCEPTGTVTRAVTGPIPGGVLETIVAPEMMGLALPAVGPLPTKVKKTDKVAKEDEQVARKFINPTRRSRRLSEQANSQEIFPEMVSTAPSHFRFLDLPPEMRNFVYSYALSLRGPTNPSRRLPTSSYVGSKARPKIARKFPSVLALLETNKQIYKEAVGAYYAFNAFVFYYPVQSVKFLGSISRERKSHIRDVTIWYKPASKQGGINIFEFALLQLSNIASLKKLRIDLDEHTALKLFRCAWLLPGEERLRNMTEKGVEVTLRCAEGDVILWHNTDERGDRVSALGAYRSRDFANAKNMIDGAQLVQSRITEG